MTLGRRAWPSSPGPFSLRAKERRHHIQTARLAGALLPQGEGETSAQNVMSPSP
jgi:hypothetical protein